MGKQLSAEGYIFDFADDVVEAFLFDCSEHRDGVKQMKAVDIIAEFPNEYLFIELKKYDAARGGIQFRCPLWEDNALVANKCPLAVDDVKQVQANVKRIARELRQKYCDTFLARYAEDKLDKTVNYICVVEGCDSGQTSRLDEIVRNHMPKGIPANTMWLRPIVKNISVVNVDGWNMTPQLSRYGRCSVASGD